MKKVISLLALSCFLAGGVFAQASDAPKKRGQFDIKAGPTPQKNAVFLDVGTLLSGLITGGFGIGAGFERAFIPRVSGLAHLAFLYYDSGLLGSQTVFQLDAHGRFYVFGTALDKLFVDVGLGYTYTGQGKGDYATTSHWLNISPKAGWKFIFGKHFVLEPSIGYDIGIGLNETAKAQAKVSGSYDGYHASGLGIGLGLGWAW